MLGNRSKPSPLPLSFPVKGKDREVGQWRTQTQFSKEVTKSTKLKVSISESFVYIVVR